MSKLETSLKQDISEVKQDMSKLDNKISKVSEKFDKIQWLILATLVSVLLKDFVFSLITQ